MRAYETVTIPKDAVSSIVLRGRPYPTLIGFLNLGPIALFSSFRRACESAGGQIMKHADE